MTENKEVLLSIKDLEIAFGEGKSRFVAVKNANFDIYKGETFSLVGESGSGKTTLLNIIGRLELPDKGDILIDDDNLKTIPERRYFKDYLGYLFQNYGLIDNESIKDNLKLAFIGKKLKNQE